MDKLQNLLNRCKCGVHITVNAHRDYYQTAAEALEEKKLTQSIPPEISPEVRAKMIELDTIIELHFYPDSPIGFFEVYHYDMDAALDEALTCIEQEGNQP
ncbi:MAG TPA: hypothetical protein DCS05_05195 [Nitrospiraceae bacterium]|nr:hypothetical protein [Nitrospiraceae bacterium]